MTATAMGVDKVDKRIPMVSEEVKSVETENSVESAQVKEFLCPQGQPSFAPHHHS